MTHLIPISDLCICCVPAACAAAMRSVSACAGAGKTTLMKKLITQALSADSSSLILYTAYNAHVVRGPDGAGEWFGKKADLPDGLKKRVACR